MTNETTTSQVAVENVTSTEGEKFLTIYLNDHLAGATSGTHRMNRLARAERESPDGEELQEVAAEIEQDEAILVDLMRQLGVERQRYKRAGAWVRGSWRGSAC